MRSGTGYNFLGREAITANPIEKLLELLEIWEITEANPPIPTEKQVSS